MQHITEEDVLQSQCFICVFIQAKVEILKVKAGELKSDFKVKATEIKELIKAEYPNAVDHIKNAIEQIKNMIEGKLNYISTGCPNKMITPFGR